jgi:hypothetical protein
MSEKPENNFSILENAVFILKDKTTEYRYVPYDQVKNYEEKGWEPREGLSGTHHAEWSILMRRRC